MASMSYCELQNAATDLGGAIYDIEMGKKSWSNDELEAARRIVDMAKELAELIEDVELEDE